MGKGKNKLRVDITHELERSCSVPEHVSCSAGQRIGREVPRQDFLGEPMGDIFRHTVHCAREFDEMNCYRFRFAMKKARKTSAHIERRSENHENVRKSLVTSGIPQKSCDIFFGAASHKSATFGRSCRFTSCFFTIHSSFAKLRIRDYIIYFHKSVTHH